MLLIPHYLTIVWFEFVLVLKQAAHDMTCNFDLTCWASTYLALWHVTGHMVGARRIKYEKPAEENPENNSSTASPYQVVSLREV